MSQQSNFDFAAFNMLTKSVPTGMKTYLALQLLREAAAVYDIYENEHAPSLKRIVTDLNRVRTEIKAAYVPRGE